jgi:D-beta-D-heptose 7-phosphate kinase/D-beta-D-heptose 1-phosphate adenosyltransferase
MSIVDNIKKWKNKKVLIIGEALVDEYYYGRVDKISPDAPVPIVKIERTSAFLGGIGRVVKYVKSLGGIPQVFTIVGDDYQGNLFLKRMKELKIDVSGVIKDKKINTPQITKIKAMNQHMLRLETDYSSNIPKSILNKLFNMIESKSADIGSIIILDYGIGGLFNDHFVQNLLQLLKQTYKNIPILARPNFSNYYIYEGIELIKMNLRKALETFSIDTSTDTSISIVGKKILNSSKSKNVLLSYLESESFLLIKNSEKVVKFNPILKERVRSYVAVGSVIMAVLGLSYAADVPILDGVKIALYSAALTASLPPVNFFNQEKLQNFILSNNQ